MSCNGNFSVSCLLSKEPLTDFTIILDLDESLIHTENSAKKLQEMSRDQWDELQNDVFYISIPMPDEPETDMVLWGTKRPNLDDLLLFCFTYFKHVCVWSAGQHNYVHTIVDELFDGFPRPHIIFTQNDCEVNKEGNYVKPISKMCKHADFEGWIQPEKTFVLDDRLYTFDKNPKNGILVPAYLPKKVEHLFMDDETFHQVRYWLMHPAVRFASDVRKIPKTDIFEHNLYEYLDSLHFCYND